MRLFSFKLLCPLLHQSDSSRAGDHACDWLADFAFENTSVMCFEDDLPCEEVFCID